MKKVRAEKKKLLELKLQRLRNLTPAELGRVGGGAAVTGMCDTSCKVSEWQ